MSKALVPLFAAFTLIACQRSDSRAVSTDAGTPAAPTAIAKADAGAVRPEDAFEVQLRAPDSVDAGPSRLVLSVTAKAGFHLNAEYPHAFRVDETSPGIQLAPKNELKDPLEKTMCADFPNDVCAANFAVPFEATANGTQQIRGTLALSVCNPNICLIERVPLAAEIDVR